MLDDLVSWVWIEEISVKLINLINPISRLCEMHICSSIDLIVDVGAMKHGYGH